MTDFISVLILPMFFVFICWGFEWKRQYIVHKYGPSWQEIFENEIRKIPHS